MKFFEFQMLGIGWMLVGYHSSGIVAGMAALTSCVLMVASLVAAVMEIKQR